MKAGSGHLAHGGHGGTGSGAGQAGQVPFFGQAKTGGQAGHTGGTTCDLRIYISSCPLGISDLGTP